MNDNYNLCIIKPNKLSFSETFIQAHIDLLAGNKKVIYGGSFPLYDHEDSHLIKSKIGLLSYLVQKKIFKKNNIKIRTRALVNYLKKQNINVVLAEYGMVGAMVTEACSLANIPLVIHYHGADVHHRNTVARYLPFYKRSFEYASALVAVSGDMVTALKKLGAPAGKLILNPYGVDTHKFSKVNVGSSGLNFLAVGRFVEKKSPKSVVKAFKIVTSQFPEARLWMVGTGPLFEETKNFADKLGMADKITFPGILSAKQIHELMQQSRCFVQHSVTAADGDMEGTPNTILEASASGLPVVSTLHAGIKEAVIDGVTGFLTAEHDIEGMAKGMIALAASAELAEKMGNAAHKHMLANYNITKRIAQLNKIIQSSIANT